MTRHDEKVNIIWAAKIEIYGIKFHKNLYLESRDNLIYYLNAIANLIDSMCE